MRVPVLSVQMIEADPRVSTAAILRIKTFSLTISLHPVLSAIVTQRGKPSGIAATVNVTATRIMNSHDGVSGVSGSLVFNARPTTNTTRHTAIAMYPIFTASASRLCCSGDWPALVSGKQDSFFLGFTMSLPSASTAATASGSSSPPLLLSSAAIVPTRVRMPVATMIPIAVPALTSHEENAMLSAVSFSATPG